MSDTQPGAAAEPVVHYFAYGSNLLPARLIERVPSARIVGIARLDDHRLVWHKQGNDGSGKCDVLPTPGQTVWGAVYALDATHKPALDAAEALGAGYCEHSQRLTLAGATPTHAIEVFYYRAQTAYIDPTAVPFDWYHQLVVHGARHHRLPDAYQNALTTVPTRLDGDGERAGHHWRLLETNSAHDSQTADD